MTQEAAGEANLIFFSRFSFFVCEALAQATRISGCGLRALPTLAPAPAPHSSTPNVTPDIRSTVSQECTCSIPVREKLGDGTVVVESPA